MKHDTQVGIVGAGPAGLIRPFLQFSRKGEVIKLACDFSGGCDARVRRASRRITSACPWSRRPANGLRTLLTK